MIANLLKNETMRDRVLTIMGIIVLIGFAFQGIFGIAAAVFLSAIIGLCYGVYRKDKVFVKWSAIALVIDLASIIGFYICLVNSNM